MNPNQISLLIGSVNSDKLLLKLFNWIADTEGFVLQDPDSINNLFSGDEIKQNSVPAVDAGQILAIAKLACQLIHTLDTSVCPIVNGM